MRHAVLTLSVILISMVGCSDEKATSGCQATADCAAGSVCIDDTCAKICSTDPDCDAGEVCSNGTCVEGTRSDGPIIEAVDGDGSPDADPTHASHHFAAGLIITGQRLEGASVELVGATSPALTVSSSSESRIDALLPTDVTAGTYAVRVFNAAGEDQGTVTLLQGEQGPPGSDADMTGDEIITRINGASTTISSERLGAGMIAGSLVTTITVRAGSARSVSLNDTGVTLDGGDGIHLVVLDTATHQVRTDISVTGPPFLHNFTMAQPLDGQNLASVLGELDDSHVVILASKGDVFGQLVEWSAAAADLGAGRGIGTLAAGDTYVLIGRPGLGSGNGLEAIVRETNGGARLTTVLADDDFVGRRDGLRRNIAYSSGVGVAASECSIGGTAGWSAWATLTDLPARTITTSGGPLHFTANVWTYTREDAQIELQFALNPGQADEQLLGTCSRSRVNADRYLHAASACDFVTALPAGTYEVNVQYRCDDAGTSTAAPDVYLYCSTPTACGFFVEEL